MGFEPKLNPHLKLMVVIWTLQSLKIPKIMRTQVKANVRTYIKYANCRTLALFWLFEVSYISNYNIEKKFFLLDSMGTNAYKSTKLLLLSKQTIYLTS